MSQAIKVGIFGIVCLAILGVLIWKVEDLRFGADRGQRLHALFDQVAGLDDKAAVRVAGVRVGRVDGIGLHGRRARVSLLLDRPLALTEGTTARIANMGLLGDKYVELVPGPPGAPPLRAEAVIEGTTPPSFDDAMAKLDAIGTSIQQVTGSLSGTLQGGGIDRLFAAIESTAAEIRLLVEENRATVGSVVRNMDSATGTLARELPRLAGEMQRAMTELASLVQENRPAVAGSVDNVQLLTEKLQTSVDNLNQISGQIASGRGTIGKLVQSDEAYQEVVSTLDSIQSGVDSLAGTIGAVNRFKFDVDLRSFYLEDREEAQSSFHLDIDPQANNRLYRAGLVRAPDGDRRTETRVVTVTQPDGTTETTTIETFTKKDGFVVSALFGWDSPLRTRLWGGIIEDSGGVAVEQPLLGRRLWTSLEAFDFNRENDLDPHLRLGARWQLHPNVYLYGGYDDPLERDSLFLGGGVRWNDDNLKWLLGGLTRF